MTTGQPHRPAILVVEDEPALRNVMARALTRAGYRVIEGTDGLEALELLEGSVRIEMVVTDVRMPDMDGLSFATAVRRRYGDMPILIISAYPPPDTMPPFARFMSKPALPADLVAAVEAALQGDRPCPT